MVVRICVLFTLVDLVSSSYRMGYILAIDTGILVVVTGQGRAACTGSCSGFVPLVLLQVVALKFFSYIFQQKLGHLLYATRIHDQRVERDTM
jgi:hypothetical protein